MTLTTVDARAEWRPGMMTDVAAAVGRRTAAVREDVYETILREIPRLGDDKPLLALLASSVDSNVDTCLQIMEHRIDLAAVRAPAAAVEYARRLAQRGTPLTALLRAYRIGHACFSDWLLRELARQAGDAEMIALRRSSDGQHAPWCRAFVAVTWLDWADALRTHGAHGALAEARMLARQAALEARRLDMPGPANRAERLADEQGVCWLSQR